MTFNTPREPPPSGDIRDFLDNLPLERQSGRKFRRLADGSVVGDWFGCELSSVFQPIVGGGDGITRGHEAFLRCLGPNGQRDLSPWVLFSANTDDDRVIALDRLARTLHALNFITSLPEDELLFLNVHGRLLAAVASDHGAAFRRVADAMGIAPDQIVIETPLAASEQVDLLAFVLRNYRQNGFRVAVNVESAAQWNALSATVPAQYIKVDGNALLERDEGLGDLERIVDSAPHATVVVTRLDAPPAPSGLPAGVWLQGHAYGGPERSPARRLPTHLRSLQFAR